MNTIKKNKQDDFNYCLIVKGTDIGLVRKANEDNLDSFDCKNGRVAVVCDGMGGHVGGAVASQTAIDAIRTFLTNNYFADPQEGIVEALNEANKAILQKAYADHALQGMGSTGLILIVRDGKVYYGSIGDSRIYIIRDRKITRLTKDESYVQMLVDSGMDPEKAEHHPRKNEITNALGLQGMTPAKTGFIDDPHAGDSFLLCSDGLTGMVPEAVIAKVVANKSVPPQERVDRLIELAKRGGGVDNITVEIVEFVIDPSALPSTTKRPAILKTAVTGVLAAIILAVAGWFIFHSGKDNASEREKITSQLPDLTITPGEKSIKLFYIVNKEDSTIIRFNKEYFEYTPDIVIMEKIPADSIALSPCLYRKISSQNSTECGFDVPEKADDFPPDGLNIVLSGKKSIHTIVCQLKKKRADGGNANKLTDDNTAKKTETEREMSTDFQIQGNNMTTSYETRCTSIKIIEGNSNTADLTDSIFSITTNFKLAFNDEDTEDYSMKANNNGSVMEETITIKETSKPVLIKLTGQRGILIINYKPKVDSIQGESKEMGES